MSRDQVEVIIGKPREGIMIGPVRNGQYQKEWVGRLGKIVIHFDNQDIVVQATFLEPNNPGWFDRVLINLDELITR